MANSFPSDSKRVVLCRSYKPKDITSSSSHVTARSSDDVKKNKTKQRGRGFLPKLTFTSLAFIAFYIVLISWMSTTVGQPYREFLERAEEEGFDVMEGEERLR